MPQSTAAMRLLVRSGDSDVTTIAGEGGIVQIDLVIGRNNTDITTIAIIGPIGHGDIAIIIGRGGARDRQPIGGKADIATIAIKGVGPRCGDLTIGGGERHVERAAGRGDRNAAVKDDVIVGAQG